MNFVEPKNIASPITGSLIRPRIITTTRGDKIYEEAHWYCPDSGQFIMKGVISIRDKNAPSPDQNNNVD